MKLSAKHSSNMAHSSVPVLLRHMLDAAREAQEFTREKTREDLGRERLLQHSVIRCIEIIGEAAARIDAAYRDANPRIPWVDIIAMRNRLIHAYFDVDLDVVWSTCQKELPELIQELEQLLDA